MRSKRTALELAKTTLEIVKKAVTCSHDIIPYEKLPFLIPANMQTYVDQFGEDRVQAYIDQLQKHENVRANVQILYKKYKDTLKSPIATLSAAVSYCGVGECHELSARCVLELGLQKSGIPFAMIQIDGKKQNVITGTCYSHIFVLIGNSSKLTTGASLDSFNSLPDDCIMLDPLLNMVAPANQFNILMKHYVATYEIDTICTVTHIDLNNDFVQSQKDAVSMANEIKKLLALNGNSMSPSVSTSLAALFSVSKDPGRQFVVKMSVACNKLEKGRLIIKAFDESKSLAFRKACSGGSAEMILLILNNRHLYPEIQLNEPSKSVERTALDWIRFNATLSATEKNDLVTALKEAGCKTFAEVKAAQNTKGL